MDNKKIVWIDWAKSLGILIVVLCHVPQYNTLNRMFFCSFQMPLFFFLAGYLYKIPTKPIKDTLKKYWTTLIVPYFLFQVIFYPYWLVLQKVDNHLITPYTITIQPVIDTLIGLPINGVTWFIVALLIIKLYADFILQLRHKWLWATLSCIIVAIIRYIMYIDNDSLKVSFAIDSMLHFFAFFFIGYYAKVTQKMDILVHNKAALYFCLICSFGITMIGITAEKPSLLISESFFYITGISGSMTLLCICIILNKITSNIVRTISSGTIIIFGLHWMFI